MRDLPTQFRHLSHSLLGKNVFKNFPLWTFLNTANAYNCGFTRPRELKKMWEEVGIRQCVHRDQMHRIPLHFARSLALARLISGSSREERATEGFYDASTGSDTIVAIATPMGNQRGSIAIVRLSGPQAINVVSKHFCSSKKRTSPTHRDWNPRSHHVEHGTIIDNTGSLVDEVLVVPMLAPRSYTKEDIIEIQCHGGDICVRRILQLCLEGGARLAQPGEFTLRAFLNGRMDLSQAESVAQLIAAKSFVAADTALAALQGGLSSFVQATRKDCLELLAEMDAHLDFEDEIPPLEEEDIIGRLNTLSLRVEDALKTSNRGRLLQSGMQVAIVGRPNVGKSSLLNAWSKVE